MILFLLVIYSFLWCFLKAASIEKEMEEDHDSESSFFT